MSADHAGDLQTDSPLSACFAPFDFAGRKDLVVAASGGGDSTALLILLKSWADANWPDIRLVVATIDHRLRPESASEAADVAQLCAQLEIEHRTLAWQGEKPATGIPAAAREARYRLLAQAAREAGTDIVLTGHTADDQAETVAMRRARGEGRGLAGMAPATLRESEIWIVRPLLAVTRKALRSYLRERGIGWIDDPTNENTSYERARVRARGAAVEPALIALAGANRVALSGAAAGLVAGHARLAAPGLVRLDRSFSEAPGGAGTYILRVLLAVLGGVEQLPAELSCRALFHRLSDGPFRATLSRTVIDSRAAGIFLHREHRDLPAEAPVREGDIWDGRFRLTIGDDEEPMLIAPTGRDAAGAIDADEFDAPPSLVRAAMAAQPRFSRANRDTARKNPVRPPFMTPLLGPWTRYLPAFDLDVANAVSALVGAAPIPEPPFQGHKGAKPLPRRRVALGKG